ncbi:MAG: signal transduction histidine kinase [Saprospiraceae bacterium]|jgi:signal transduction histidine kinase
MPEEQIHKLLKESSEYFLKRDLKIALKSAEIALELSKLNTFTKGIIQSNLLLGKIYTASGRFHAAQDNFPKALEFIEQADLLNQPPYQNGSSVEIYLAFGDIFQHQSAFDKAVAYYKNALDYGKQEGNKEGIIKSLCALSYHYVLQKELDTSFVYINEAITQIDETTPESVKAEVNNQICQVFIKKQEYTSVLKYGLEALKISKGIGETEKELTALNNIAVYYGVFADYKTAMEYFLEALEKSKSINFRKNTSQSLINIATIYASLFNYQEAINRYQTVLAEYDDVIDDYTRVIVCNNLGNIYYHSDDPRKAINRFEEAYELAVKINYREMIAHTLAQKGRTNAALKNFDLALKNAEEAQVLITELGEINGKQINLINFGNIYYHKKEFDKAIKLTSQGIVAAKRMKDEENEIRGYQILAKIYQELQNFEKALSYQLIYSKAQEGFAKEQRSRQVLDMEIQFAIQQKQKEIEQLTRDNEYQALLLTQSDQIANQNVQLLQVNEELRQFAYVASHDLKEPLRMIGSYTQLIQRKFKAEVDEDTASFFGFVSEGVIRMNNLLDALLKYATIGKSELEIEKVNLNDILDICRINLQVSIAETNTIITVKNPLPVVHSVQSLLIQLFQNLISNAIKFRKEDIRPEIKVFSKEDEDQYKIYISDNGIGINPEFQERIFIIFQRLHTRSQYEGTGIGLAVCQKIVQKLGGVISVKSQLDQGATFSFTIPKK